MTPPDEAELRRMLAVLDAPSDSFAELARIGGVDPAKAFRGANLRDIDFGDDDLAGFVFARADLRGADLSRTRGLTLDALRGARMDSATKGPRGSGGFPPRIPLVVWRDRRGRRCRIQRMKAGAAVTGR